MGRKNNRGKPLYGTKVQKFSAFRNVCRYVLYLVFIFVAFIFSTTGDFRKPILMIPIVIGISSASNPAVAGGAGILCGLLTDISTSSLFGYHALVFFLIALAVQSLYHYYWSNHILLFLLSTGVASLVVTGLDFLFRYAVWGFSNLAYYYTHYALVYCLYTVISSVVLYLLFFLIHHFLRSTQKIVAERKVKSIEEG